MSNSASQNFSFQAMVFTACLFPVYIAAAALSNSAALLTDMLSTLIDLMALTTCWMVLRLANRAQAGKYAYGLGKLENLAELFIALLQTGLVIFAGSHAIARLMAPEGVEGAELGMVVTAIAVAGNLILNRKATKLARATHSPVLNAQARVHLVSAASSGSVFLITGILTTFEGIPALYYLDPLGSFVVIGFMVYNIHAMLTNSMGSLLDQAIDEASQLRILKVLTTHFDDYSELADIRTRQLGGKMFVELHLGFNDDWTIAETRRVAARLTASVKRAFQEAGDEVDVAIVLVPAPVDEAAPTEAPAPNATSPVAAIEATPPTAEPQNAAPL